MSNPRTKRSHLCAGRALIYLGLAGAIDFLLNLAQAVFAEEHF